MNKTINVGVIGYGMTEEELSALAISHGNKFHFKKVIPANKIAENIAGSQYPEAEIVHDVNDIVKDDAIELVFISASENESRTVEEVLQSGKHLRIV